MNYIKSNLTALVALAVATIVGVCLIVSVHQPVVHSTVGAQVGGTTNYNNLVLSGSMIDGGLCNVNVSSTTIVLTGQQLQYCSVIAIVGSSSAQTTVIFPGTTTLSSSGILVNAGDQWQTVVYDATTTGSSLLLNGTGGTTVQTASSSAVITTNHSATLNGYQQASGTDIFLLDGISY